MPAPPAVIGASDHIGWAELVTVGVRAAAPVLLDRRRVELVAADLPSAPYHHEAPEMELAAATALVARVTRSVQEHARAALSTLMEEHGARALILAESPYGGLPGSLADVLASRALTCAADGMLYREALADAGAGLGLDVRRYPRRTDPTGLAAEALARTRAQVSAHVEELGRAAGTPWRKEHKLAAAAALLVLADRLRS